MRTVELLLVGTGGPRGWPEPGCPCASCATAVARRQARAATAVLVDGVLLLDGGPAEDTAAQHVLHALPHGDGWAYDVTAPDGTRLLHAPRRAPLPPLTGPYDVVLLDLARLPESLAQLRRSGAVTAASDVLAVGIGHDSPLPDELERLLVAWGARAVPDGTTVEVAASGAGFRQGLRGRTLVLGGVRSGKSALAEQLLAAAPDVTYVATGGRRAGDAEWQQRVAAHVARRPATWSTVETTDVAGCLRAARGPLLVDCLGTWLTARLDHHGVWESGSTAAVDADVEELIAAWRAALVPVVAVSNEVGSGVVPATPAGRLFRDLLGRLNSAVARESETVLLSVAGLAVPLRSP